MIPAPRLFGLLLAWGLFAIAASIWPQLLSAWIIIGKLLALIILTDAFLLFRQPTITVERKVMNALPLGNWVPVQLRLHNPTTYARRVDVFDHHPQDSEQSGLPVELKLPGSGWGQLNYRMRPLKRGTVRFTYTQLHIHSSLGLWKRNRRVGSDTEVRVYPNFAAVMKYSLLATDQRVSQMGILKKRRRGEGMEFHQLREYREGDSLRQIDWKATARTRKLISRDYQEERDQQIIFLVDCGRRMLTEDNDLSHFDHTLNAILLLAHVALRQGDAVGLLTFSGDDRWMAPRKSLSSINLILNTIYDLQPKLESPDYSSAALQLMRHQKRRSLVILITNLRDEDTADLLPALKVLRKRHLVLLASLRETVMENVLNKQVSGFEDALEHAAIHHYLGYRNKVHQTLEQEGVLYVDVNPSQLPVNIVNRYLDIKSRGLL